MASYPSAEEDPAVFWSRPLFDGACEEAFGELGVDEDLGFVRDSMRCARRVVVYGTAGARTREGGERESERASERARGGTGRASASASARGRACARANEGGMWTTDGAMRRVMRRMIG